MAGIHIAIILLAVSSILNTRVIRKLCRDNERIWEELLDLLELIHEINKTQDIGAKNFSKLCEILHIISEFNTEEAAGEEKKDPE